MRIFATVAAVVLVSGCAQREPELTASDLGVEAFAVAGKSPAAGPCDPSQFMTGRSFPHCCQDGNRVWYIATPPGSTIPALFFRRLGTPCTLVDGTTSCGFGTGVQCYFGPCGGASNVGVFAAELNVFVPTSRPAECGWEASGITSCLRGCDWDSSKETRYYPEPYEGQETYAGVDGTCPAKACYQGRPCMQDNCSDQI